VSGDADSSPGRDPHHRRSVMFCPTKTPSSRRCLNRSRCIRNTRSRFSHHRTEIGVSESDSDGRGVARVKATVPESDSVRLRVRGSVSGNSKRLSKNPVYKSEIRKDFPKTRNLKPESDSVRGRVRAVRYDIAVAGAISPLTCRNIPTTAVDMSENSVDMSAHSRAHVQTHLRSGAI